MNIPPTRAGSLALAALMPGGGASSGSAQICSPEAARDALGDEYLVQQGLAPLWASLPADGNGTVSSPRAADDALARCRTAAAAKYLLQRAALAELDGAFDRAGIEYVVFKGAHVREWLYGDPALRDPADVDVLIHSDDSELAVTTLLHAGFVPKVDRATVSHELILLRRGVEIDLHWHLMRPGRLRVDPSRQFLARRRRLAGLWTLSPTDAVFVMLVHPAFTKYVSSPAMSLIRAYDFLLAVGDRGVDWQAVAALLDECGTRAAGWAVLSWFQMLHPVAHAVPAGFAGRLRPGRIRVAYFRWWLQHDLPTRLYAAPLLVQVGLTLALHDTARDALRAVGCILAARRDGTSHPVFRLAMDYDVGTGSPA